MTDEQIKRNAKEYAHKINVFAEDKDIYLAAKDGYVSGAHSRDEEVETLQNQIEELSEQLKMNAENIQKLRNPWISVKERMPEKSNKNKNYSVNCIVRYTDEYLFPGQVFYTEAYYDYGYEKKSPYNKGGWIATYNDDEHFFFSDYEEYGCVVTHWMPIPKV